MAELILEKAINLLIATKPYSTEIRDILTLIAKGARTIHCLEYLESKNLEMKDIKSQAMEVVLDYAELILEDDILSENEILNVRFLRMLFGIEDGEFFEYGKRKRVEAILAEQLEKLYADNKIDKEEMLHKSELQGLFGLGYDDYQEIVNKVAIDAYSRGADIRDLDTYL